MNKKEIKLKWIIPILLSFFVMSFCDLVGIGVDRIKGDFNLSDKLAQLIPSAVFLWFLILSIPFGLAQDRIGKRRLLSIGLIVTAIGLFIPFAYYSYSTTLIAFGFLGIGNTIVQVSANPLLVDVVPDNKRSSFLSFSQFIKTIGSWVATPLAWLFTSQFGDWKIMFIAFGVLSILSALWLMFTSIDETTSVEKHATFASSFSLLSNKFNLMMVGGIFFVVGIDVGMNSNIGQFLFHRFNCAQKLYESAHSIYYLGKMIGTFCGAVVLAMISSRKFLFWSSVSGVFAIIALLVVPHASIALIITFIIGLVFSNIWPLIFSLTIEKSPEHPNEISGLMIMAIFGGAVIPPVIGSLMYKFGPVAGMAVLVLCAAYLLFVSFVCRNKVGQVK